MSENELEIVLTPEQQIRLSESVNHARAVYTGIMQQYGLPSYMHEGVVEYIVSGRPCGDFLRCVLCNELVDAVKRADDQNKHLITRWAWLMDKLPIGSWGTPNNYRKWVAQRGLTPLLTRAAIDGEDVVIHA